MIPLRDRNPRRSLPYVTLAIGAICAIVFGYQYTLGDGPLGYRFVLEYGFVPARLTVEPLAAIGTLVSHAFLHGSVLHLAGNLLFLIVFADNVEDRVGHGRFLLFYLASAAAAAAVQGVLGGDPEVPLVGASGAISACLGAYLRLFPRQFVQAFIPAFVGPWLFMRLFSRQRAWYAPWLPAWIFLGYWILVQVLEAFGGAGGEVGGEAAAVAWWAHVGGFAFGVAGATWLAPGRARGRTGRLEP